MEEKRFELHNFLLVQKICGLAFDNTEFLCVIGDTGSGKSVGLEHFAAKNPKRARYLYVRPSMKINDFFYELSFLYDYHGDRRNKYAIMSYLSEYYKDIEGKEVLLLDEGGKLKPNQFIFIQELHDLTRSKLGIVISGPEDFLINLSTWVNNRIIGTAEFKRRLQLTVQLGEMTKKEVLTVCKSYGISDSKLVAKRFLKYRNIGKLTNEIKNYHNGYDDLSIIN